MNRQRKIIDRLYHQFEKDFCSDSNKLNKHQISEFQRSEFGINSILSDDDFNEWLYIPTAKNQRTFCLSDNQIVGQQSALPSKISLTDKTIDCVCAINLMVKEDWRMKGVGVALMGELINNHELVICLGVSDDAHRMFIRQGWSDMGKTHCFIKPMKLKLTKEYTWATNLLKNILLTCALTLSKMTDFFFRLFSNRLPIIEVKNKVELDDSMLLAQHPAGKIQFKRDLNYLAWRYFDNPSHRSYQVFRVGNQDSVLPGYFVVKVANYENKKALIISEIEATPKNMSLFVDAIIALAKRKNTDIILYYGLNLELEKKLISRKFYQRPSGDIFVYYSNNKDIEILLSKKENWVIKFSDSDMDFVFY